MMGASTRNRWNRLAIAAALALLAAVGAESSELRAATVIEQEVHYARKRGVETDAVEHQRYVLSKDHARLEQGQEVYLVDTTSGEYYYLDLEQKHFDRFRSPFALENILPAEYLQAARRSFEARQPSNVNVLADERTKEIDGHEVKHVRIEAGTPGKPVVAVLDLWISPALKKEVEDTAYFRLQSDRLSTSPVTAWLVKPLQSLEGFPVMEEVSMEVHGQKTQFTRKVLSFELGVEVPPSLFEVPQGFTPFPDSGLKIVTPAH